VCHAPDANQQDECYCTSATCGAGMLDAANAVSAAATVKAWIVPSATQVAIKGVVSLDGTSSWTAPPASITTRNWTFDSGSQLATLQDPSAATASLLANSPGTVVVRLAVTDSQGRQSSDVTTIEITSSSASGGGGGGTMSWPWLLGLGLAVAALRPRRRA